MQGLHVHRAWPEGGAARQGSSLFQPQNPPGEDLTRAVCAIRKWILEGNPALWLSPQLTPGLSLLENRQG